MHHTHMVMLGNYMAGINSKMLPSAFCSVSIGNNVVPQIVGTNFTDQKNCDQTVRRSSQLLYVVSLACVDPFYHSVMDMIGGLENYKGNFIKELNT